MSSQTPSTSNSGILSSSGLGLEGNGDSGFNVEAEFKALKATVDDVMKENAEMREMLDRFDGESAEIRLLVEKYENR